MSVKKSKSGGLGMVRKMVLKEDVFKELVFKRDLQNEIP